jgi:hypothetical protein
MSEGLSGAFWGVWNKTVKGDKKMPHLFFGPSALQRDKIGKVTPIFREILIECV